uniref:Uncharacterized protein TCIL3000_11_13110 n=1 Tax=Trypanosoma congolense (strain IL3000) TaxID=1068625 RepID=G0V2E0_TRYCI|nr:unnamed protein product [Trypanosoma congolense IL3000]
MSLLAAEDDAATSSPHNKAAEAAQGHNCGGGIVTGAGPEGLVSSSGLTLPAVQQASQGRKDVQETKLPSKLQRWGRLGGATELAPDGSPQKSGPEQQPVGIRDSVAPLRITQGGIPLERYRAKLEECAALHAKLDEMATAQSVTQEQLYAARGECDALRNEILRLRDMLATATGELSIHQRQVLHLERENLVLRTESRKQQMEGATAGDQTDLSTQSIQAPSYGSHMQTIASGPAWTPTPPQQHGISGNLRSSRRLTRMSTSNAPDAVELYVKECFRSNVIPHMELLQSLYEGRQLAGVEPPLTYVQLKALQKVIMDSKWVSGEPVQPTGTRPSGRLCGQRCNRLGDTASNGMRWFEKLDTMTFRCENWRSSITLVVELIRSLPHTRNVELFNISDESVMRQLAETLAMEHHVDVLSLPELALNDEGLVTLFTLILRRDQLATSNATGKKQEQSTGIPVVDPGVVPVTRNIMGDSMLSQMKTAAADGDGVPPPTLKRGGASNGSMFGMYCLDLGRCILSNPTYVFKSFRCPALEVLVLPSSREMRDIHVRNILEACPRLHTLDISGNTALSTACVKYIAEHRSLKVLRMENCPGIGCLDITNVEVLFASLLYVISLHAPGLRRLPVPISHSRVLFDFKAPNLREITLKGIIVDAGTLSPFTKSTNEGVDSPTLNLSSMSGCERAGSLDHVRQSSEAIIQLLSAGFISCTFADDRELKQFVRRQQQLLRLSLHNCKGVKDSHLSHLPPTLLELDLGNVAQLNNKSLDIISNNLPQLIKLNLKNAGPQISNAGVRSLHGLVHLEVLNLLLLPQVETDVVSGLASELTRLRKLYHETAIVGPRDLATAASTAVNTIVCRVDEEDSTKSAVEKCGKELLQLRDETSLSLWMEAQLPRPQSIFPSRATLAHTVDFNASNPPLTTNTTFYEMAMQGFSSGGGGDGNRHVTRKRPTSNYKSDPANSSNEGGETVNVLVVGSDDGLSEAAAMTTGGEEENVGNDDACEKSLSTNSYNYGQVENVLDEKNRLVIDRKPLGPWDEEDLVEEHRKHSPNGPK